MSGGVYDYVCFAEPNDLFHQADALSQIADALTRRPDGAQAAVDTREVVRVIRAIGWSSEGEGLRDVWHAIEWEASGDFNTTHVTAALVKYNATVSPAARDAAILRDLAATDPIDDHGNCTLCGAYVGGMPDENDPARHHGPCPWRRARAR